MIVVAIDGPAGVGKSSTSKALAHKFGFAYLDTGLMYRLATWWCLREKISSFAQTQDVEEAVAALFTDHELQFSRDPQHEEICIDGTFVETQVLRSEEVTSHVSQLSRIPLVRSILIAAQRAYINQEALSDSFSSGKGIVVEGRDITTVVYPQAQVKILLTADADVRQKRRDEQNLEQQEKKYTVVTSDPDLPQESSSTHKLTLMSDHIPESSHVQKDQEDNVALRDALDLQTTHFSQAALGVVTIDNTDLSFEQTVARIASLIEDYEHTENSEAELKDHSGIQDDLHALDPEILDEYELSEEDNFLLDHDFAEDDELLEHENYVGSLAVIGRPNVGKSTLVNRILGRRAAVVEDTPGVTRDRVRYDAQWAGSDFTMVDTGGWESNVEGIDQSIANQAQIAMNMSDAILFVVDGQVGITATDEKLVQVIRKTRKPVIVAVNKVDQSRQEYMSTEFWSLGLGEPYSISAMHGRGIGDLLDVCIKALKDNKGTNYTSFPTNLRRISLVGRPNVGKSSLLNKLAQEERSVVNDLAGTTRDPVDEVISLDGQDWLFIDTAGIKRRTHKLSGAEYYSHLRTQAAIERSELALVLFDASVPISDQDLKVMSQAVDAGRAIVLIFNKWDLLDDFDRQRVERLWNTEFTRMTWAQRVNLSAKTGWHTNRLTQAMNQALSSWDQRVPTAKLNAFLGQLQSSHPHPLRGGKQPRILFATQVSHRPPRFVIFATGFLEHSYRRFIERSLRDEFGFHGSPIQISINIRQKKKRH